MRSLGSAFGSSGAVQLSTGVERQTRREVEQVQSRAIIAKLTEDGRAFLTHTALEHVGALTALEQHLITVAPLGEARYREIVDSYTLGASAAIRRWS
ncbi:hypothetical protein [Microbacterium sp. T32]|uniref:hypothetical protein n=1 Tax=Microbacterium sp. T32 TaxID=1776083 RepID=UPI0012E96F5D|nr:hypothetical protein [Microbacterium sp. T32]